MKHQLTHIVLYERKKRQAAQHALGIAFAFGTYHRPRARAVCRYRIRKYYATAHELIHASAVRRNKCHKLFGKLGQKEIDHVLLHTRYGLGLTIGVKKRNGLVRSCQLITTHSPILMQRYGFF